MNSSDRRRTHPHPLISAAVLRRHNNLSSLAGASSPVNFPHAFPTPSLSARKLAARLWHLPFLRLSQLPNKNATIMLPTTHQPEISRSRNGIPCELQSSLPCIKCCKEDATRIWDAALSQPSNHLTHILKRCQQTKVVVPADSVVSVLVAQLLQAERYIHKLKAARKYSNKKIQQLVLKCEKEKMGRKDREFQRVEAMLDDIKEKLERERRSRERMELMNAKLVHELAEANRSMKRFMKKYKEEKRGRELMEQVCNELGKQIGEDKGRMEELERESTRIREEVEEERKMIQIAEMWREERIQMKIVDARHALEDKYDEMIQLVSRFLHNFLASRGVVAELDKIQGIVELSCDFWKFDEEDGLDSYNSKLHHQHQSSSSSDNTCLESPKTQVSDKCFSESGGEFELKREFSEAMINPHISRGIKGCIEWPRGIPAAKSNMKALSLDARVRSQKSQLQHMLNKTKA